MKKKSYGELNNLNLKVIVSLSRSTQKLHKRAGRIFNEDGLTTSQFAVLEALYHKGQLTVNEIIERILSTSGNMTVVISNLEKNALIEKKSNPADKRSWLISITEKGKKKFEGIFPKHLEDLKESLLDLTEGEKRTLVDILKKIKA